MAVSVDTVYQKVLALASKEQRGYITPQEFNLFAGLAQMEIIDQYFYDLNQYSRAPSKGAEYSDMVSLINEKLSIFKMSDVSANTNASGALTFPVNLYKFGSIYSQSAGDFQEMEQKEYQKYKIALLAAPSVTTPIFCRVSNGLQAYPQIAYTTFINYITSPPPPKWGHVVVMDKALYDPSLNKTTNFMVHASEETELVYKILLLAGIAIQRQDIASAAQGMEQAKLQQEKQ